MSRGTGFGTVRKMPSGRYQARYHGPDGRRHSGVTTFVKITDARRWLAAEQTLMASGDWSPPKQREAAKVAAEEAEAARQAAWAAVPTLDAWVETVIRRRAARSRKPLKETTAGLYRRDWAARSGALGPVRLDELSEAMVKDWLAAMPATPTRNGRAYDLLKSVMGEAVEDGLVAVNPCRVRGAGKPAPAREGVALSAGELLAYLRAVPGHRRVMLMVAGTCGLRSGELRGLWRRDVDVDERVLWVRRQAVRVQVDAHHYEYRLSTPKTAAAVRSVAMPQMLVEPLRAHLLSLPMPGPDALVFPAADGRSIMSESVIRDAHAVGRQAIDRPELTVHDLRRTAATLAAQDGATVRELMAMLGHTTVQVAMAYQRADAVRDRQRADRLDARLGAAAS